MLAANQKVKQKQSQREYNEVLDSQRKTKYEMNQIRNSEDPISLKSLREAYELNDLQQRVLERNSSFPNMLKRDDSSNEVRYIMNPSVLLDKETSQTKEQAKEKLSKEAQMKLAFKLRDNQIMQTKPSQHKNINRHLMHTSVT